MSNTHDVSQFKREQFEITFATQQNMLSELDHLMYVTNINKAIKLWKSQQIYSWVKGVLSVLWAANIQGQLYSGSVTGFSDG